jgi:glycosyltransferase involved in cell wall biosynthesis
MSVSSYDHIVNIRLSRFDRIKIPFYRYIFLNGSKYHFMSFVWPDSNLKRKVVFSEAIFVSRRGKIICASNRLYQALKPWAQNVHFILPPVPHSYFLKPDEKPENDKIKITFLGVVYPNKGIEEVIEIFKVLKDDNRFETLICAIYEPRNKKSVEIRNWLKIQDIIQYIEVDRYNYLPSVEEMTGKILKETDVFIQPYTSLGSTVDIPLLVLEAMASLCAVVTTPLGSIPEVYGNSKFLMDTKDVTSKIVSFFKNISYDEIIRERTRVYEQNQILEFEASKVAGKFIEILRG